MVRRAADTTPPSLESWFYDYETGLPVVGRPAFFVAYSKTYYMAAIARAVTHGGGDEIHCVEPGVCESELGGLLQL